MRVFHIIQFTGNVFSFYPFINVRCAKYQAITCWGSEQSNKRIDQLQSWNCIRIQSLFVQWLQAQVCCPDQDAHEFQSLNASSFISNENTRRKRSSVTWATQYYFCKNWKYTHICTLSNVIFGSNVKPFTFLSLCVLVCRTKNCKNVITFYLLCLFSHLCVGKFPD